MNVLFWVRCLHLDPRDRTKLLSSKELTFLFVSTCFSAIERAVGVDLYLVDASKLIAVAAPHARSTMSVATAGRSAHNFAVGTNNVVADVLEKDFLCASMSVLQICCSGANGLLSLADLATCGKFTYFTFGRSLIDCQFALHGFCESAQYYRQACKTAKVSVMCTWVNSIFGCASPLI